MTVLHRAWLVIPRRLRLKARNMLVMVFPSFFIDWLRNDMGFGVIKKIYIEKGCLLIHVPKTAGTSLAKAIYGFHGLGHYTAREFRDLSPDLYNQFFVIGFVRNPWSRLVSAYFFVLQGGTDKVSVDKSTGELVSRFTDFRQFVLEWVANVDMESAPIVFRPQYTFLCDEDGQVIVDFVGHVETIQEDFLKIKSVVALKNSDVCWVNRSSHADYEDYYDDEMREIVARVYREDIKLFGYSFGNSKTGVLLEV